MGSEDEDAQARKKRKKKKDTLLAQQLAGATAGQGARSTMRAPAASSPSPQRRPRGNTAQATSPDRWDPYQGRPMPGDDGKIRNKTKDREKGKLKEKVKKQKSPS